MRQPMPRRRKEHHAVAPQEPDRETRIGTRARGDRDIRAIIEQVIEHRGRVADPQAEGQARGPLAHPSQQRHRVGRTVRRDSQMALPHGAHAFEQGLRLVLRCKEARGDVEQFLPQRRQGHAAPLAIEKCCVVPFFQQAHLAREGRLTDAGRLRSAGEAARACHGMKGTESGNRHDAPSKKISKKSMTVIQNTYWTNRRKLG